MANLNLEIITPSKITFSGEINSVTIPGTLGSFQVLKNHAPLISTFEIGLLKIEKLEHTIEYYATSGGTVEVLNNKVLVLADAIELGEEIDIERAESAKRRAKERLDKRGGDKVVNVERAEAALKRAINRLDIVEKYIRGLKGSLN
ncbi:MAG: F0F1 ATP synthase subunit epsilon [Ignavibacteriaceae bacterium]